MPSAKEVSRGRELEGDEILVDYDEDTIKNAPRIDADGDLTPREELALFRYYSQPHDTGRIEGDTTDRDQDQLERAEGVRDRDTAEDHQRVVDEIADRRTDDRRAGGRLRRYVVTEITEDR